MNRWLFVLAVATAATAGAQRPSKGILLEDLTWQQAELLLTPETVVVIPLGAASKEHGPHLKLSNDLILANYLTQRVIERSSIVVAPPVTYHFYPGFLEYPGSTSLRQDTARDLVVDVVRSLAGYGPRRFYVLNTGISTVRSLRPAADLLADDGLLLRFTDLARVLDPIERQIRQEQGGTHADEIETSMLLYIDPASVDMRQAVKDYDASGRGPLSRKKGKPNTTFSPTGIWGDPTLATAEKGRVVVEALVGAVLREIEETRVAAVPTARPRRDLARRPAAGLVRPDAVPAFPGPPGPPGGLERELQAVLNTFMTSWSNVDSWGVASLWTEDGSVGHVDGVVERGRQTILQARAMMFARREYRTSRHSLWLGDARLLAPGVALATGRWRLTGVTGEDRIGRPEVGGACVMIFQNVAGEGWRFAALQYVEHGASDPPPLTKIPNAVVR